MKYSYCTPKFNVLNAAQEVVFVIVGPCCGKTCDCAMCGTVAFDIFLPDETTNVGQVTKFYSGFVQEYFTDADNFGAKFPMDLDPRLKAVLLGAVFAIVSNFVALNPRCLRYMYIITSYLLFQDFLHFQKDRS